jgi:hypothetical protein
LSGIVGPRGTGIQADRASPHDAERLGAPPNRH